MEPIIPPQTPAGAQEPQPRALPASLSVTKESLIDWSVRDGRRVVAWITRDNGGYRVTFTEFGKDHPGYWYRYFREAKEFALRA